MEGKDTGMHEGTGGAPITGTSFGPITREDSRKAIKILGGWSEIGADPWVMRIVQWGYKIPFVTLPPLRLQEQETTYPKGSLKWSPLNQSVQELWNKGAIEPAPLTPGFYSRLFLVRKATGEWDLRPPSMSSCIARASLWRRLGQSSGPYTGPVVNLPRPESAYFHIGIDPADRRYLRFCHTAPLDNLQYCYLSTSPRVFTKYSNLY